MMEIHKYKCDQCNLEIKRRFSDKDIYPEIVWTLKFKNYDKKDKDFCSDGCLALWVKRNMTC